jgi:hypothetical protein
MYNYDFFIKILLLAYDNDFYLLSNILFNYFTTIYLISSLYYIFPYNNRYNFNLSDFDALIIVFYLQSFNYSYKSS